MAKPRALGRGLDALLGGDSQPESGDSANTIREIPITEIDPNVSQPRKRFLEAELNELADSIKAVGIISPILVYKNKERYTIIAGERRWRAARKAGLITMPAIIREYDTVRRMEISLIENLQRNDLDPIEEASAIAALMEECGLTQEAVATRLGKSRPSVANALRLLTLSDEIIELVITGQLSASHARALVAIDNPMLQLQLANKAVAEGWSVRQIEQAAKAPLKLPKPIKKPLNPELLDVERMARDVFGTKVQVKGTMTKGKITLEYFDREDLERIYDLLEIMRQAGQ